MLGHVVLAVTVFLCDERIWVLYVHASAYEHLTNIYFVLWPTSAQLFHRLSHCYMFRHYRVILRQLVINCLAKLHKYFKFSCW